VEWNPFIDKTITSSMAIIGRLMQIHLETQQPRGGKHHHQSMAIHTTNYTQISVRFSLCKAGIGTKVAKLQCRIWYDSWDVSGEGEYGNFVVFINERGNVDGE
jgi:hypothetical protein